MAVFCKERRLFHAQNTPKPCYTNVVIPDNTTEVLLPLQLNFCHSQPAERNSAVLKKDLEPKILQRSHEVLSVLFRSQPWSIKEVVEFSKIRDSYPK
jgi:hypothetical protein